LKNSPQRETRNTPQIVRKPAADSRIQPQSHRRRRSHTADAAVTPHTPQTLRTRRRPSETSRNHLKKGRSQAENRGATQAQPGPQPRRSQGRNQGEIRGPNRPGVGSSSNMEH